MAGPVAQPQQQAWMSERLSLLSQPVLVEQITTTADAARSLQQAWNKLLSNDLTAAEIQAITAELAPVIASLEALTSKTQTTTTTSTTNTTGTTGSTGGTQP
jgi:predicted PurR-regulated permease PerM